MWVHAERLEDIDFPVEGHCRAMVVGCLIEGTKDGAEDAWSVATPTPVIHNGSCSEVPVCSQNATASASPPVSFDGLRGRSIRRR